MMVPGGNASHTYVFVVHVYYKIISTFDDSPTQSYTYLHQAHLIYTIQPM